jgi:alpha-glucosidase
MGDFHSSVSKSIGNLTAWSKVQAGLNAETTFGRFQVLTYGASIIRITATLTESFEDFSYSVVALPQPDLFEISENPDSLILKTEAVELHISKSPVRFTFRKPDGRIIHADDPLGISWIGEQVTAYKKLQPGERFIGLGEKTGPLDRKGAAYQNWTTDAYAYHSGSDPLYCSTPFYIGLHQQMVYGIFLDNTHKTFFNFGASNHRFASFAADQGEMNYYFISGENVAEIIRHYTHLTGRMELPPLWSIGYQQCRYSYYPDKEVITLANTFRDKDIPADVIVFDIHYMDKYKIFTWDKKNFPDPEGMIRHLKEKGFHVVVMCDPGIKVEPGYEAYDDGVAQDVFIKYPDGENYQGQVWPGWCHFPDFTNPKTRTWWAAQFKHYVSLGIEGFWNDMNEIATWGHALPENLVFDFEGKKTTSRRGRNVYGFQMARSTYEGAKKLLNGKRPFNLTRSGFSGVQRYAAVWTGDNVSYDEHMLLGVRLVNSLGLTGIAFAGYDAGGFVGEANTKLFARWMSIASLSPFFRAHTMINTRDSEPWSYGEEAEQICRNYIRFRYQLMPYIYSLFHEAAQTGMPVQRSLAIDFPFEPKVYEGAYHNQYLFGPAILVAPVESNKELMKIFLPAGEWYDVYTGKIWEGNREMLYECPVHKLPVFMKAGSVLPAHVSTPHTGVKPEKLILHVYCGKASSEFLFYSDDGVTFDYQEENFHQRWLRYEADQSSVKISRAEGKYNPGYKTLNVVMHGCHSDQVTINHSTHVLTPVMHSFFSPLEKYDPINDPDPMGEEPVKTVSIPYTSSEVIIAW